MKLENFALLLLVLFAAAYAGWYFYDNQQTDFITTKLTSPLDADQQTATPNAGEVAREHIPMPPRHPVPPLEQSAKPVEPPFPTSLDETDAYLQQRLSQLIDKPELLKLLTLSHFIQKLVVIIDQLPEKSIPRLHLPLLPPEPGFRTSGSDDQLLIDAQNARRYLPYAQLAEALPDQLLLRLYRGLYPLFQQAYRESGNADGYFNDRLIQVIDHLLQTPEPQEPLRVIRHIRSFRYADESLEARSAGQKTLLRMGLENARRIKTKLLRLRQGLVQLD
jgi:Protein of unknown function (DUF3014)